MSPDSHPNRAAPAVEAALKSADEMIAVARQGRKSPGPGSLHGSNATAWGVLDEAIRRGLDTRCGLERHAHIAGWQLRAHR